MKNIYDKINDIEVNVEDIELTDKEKSTMTNAAKSYGRNPVRIKRWMPIAAAIVLMFSLTIPKVRATGL